ncbi:MAG: pyridoxamine 5'-phosphate oxidase family protein [Candidatus Paceibacterota bacterium]
MKLPSGIIAVIEGADNKVLATIGEDGPNVIPLSMVIVDGDDIIVCDCFMDKTVKNLSHDSRAAMAFWKGFVGVQIKGHISYETSGEHFDRYTKWLKGKHTDRTLRGVLLMSAEEVYDLAPSNAGVKIA